MCGIAGILDNKPSGQPMEKILSAMTAAIVSRGPDDEGHWWNAEQGIGLGHRRLSIVDLSSAGHQPMLSPCGRWVIVFNGEIYNHVDIRHELEEAGKAPTWRGHSDTEVLLSALTTFGIEETLKKCVGMFAFGLWDSKERELVLARDRMGEKPLYYGRIGGAFVFASELKALYRHPQWEGEIDRGALALMMRHNCIPAPYSIYRNIAKLPPASIARVRAGEEPRLTRYWNIHDVALQGEKKPFDGTPQEAVDEVEFLLKQSLAGQMVADVPLGAFLSGGVDSSTVVALMQSMSARPVKTFSIGFSEGGYNEAAYAKAVANHLGTEHTELYVSPREAMDVIPSLPRMYDEPYADSSQIPTFLVSRLARQHVTVSLSGDGGDELFSGYSRYKLAHSLWPRLELLPLPFRSGAASILQAIPTPWLNRLAHAPFAFMPQRYRQTTVGDKLHKLADILSSPSIGEVYRRLTSHWKNPADVVVGGQEYTTPVNGSFDALGLGDPVKCMMYLDQITYLPDDILVKLDRASMGVSLESRVPMLDHRLVEFAWSLPLSILRRGGVSKWPLRHVLYKYVPKSLIDRPKMGFGIPLDAWLRGPLRDWAEDLLGERRLREEGYFNPAPVRQMWAEHTSGLRNRQYEMWDVLMFQAWLEMRTTTKNW
jgi:asparagine synthase (glutamine-hydrolysing)